MTKMRICIQRNIDKIKIEKYIKSIKSFPQTAQDRTNIMYLRNSWTNLSLILDELIKGPATVYELSLFIPMSESNLYRLCKKLEKKRYIKLIGTKPKRYSI